MFNQIALLLVVLAVVSAHHPRNFTCTIKNAPHNVVQGTIQIQYDGTNTTFILALTDPTNKLHPSGSGFHVHGYGFSALSTSCGDAGKHYNPILNYGEISARAGKIPSTGTATLTANWFTYHDYSIVGRSLVVHDNTTLRLGCCTIMSLNDDAGDFGWSSSVLKAQFNGLNVTIYNNSNGVVSANYSIDPLVYLNVPGGITIGKAGDCSGDILPVGVFPGLTNVSNTSALEGVPASNFTDYAGRSFQIDSNTLDCAVLYHSTAQPNIAGNDFYVDPTATTTSATTATSTSSSSTAASSTGNGMMIVFSVVLLVVASLF
jgi:Cu/Zn superoxide dismutase